MPSLRTFTHDSEYVRDRPWIHLVPTCVDEFWTNGAGTTITIACHLQETKSIMK